MLAAMFGGQLGAIPPIFPYILTEHIQTCRANKSFNTDSNDLKFGREA